MIFNLVRLTFHSKNHFDIEILIRLHIRI